VKRILALAFVVVAISCKRPPPPEPPPSSLDDTVRPYYDRARVPAIGYAAITANRANVGVIGAKPDTVFAAASIAKTIVATCVMQIAAEALVDLDADVSRYLGFPVKRPVTLRMLLAHTSSMTDDFTELEKAGDLEPFLRTYVQSAHYSDDAPGARMQYSNAGTALAALVVEKVRKKPFAEVTRERVFRPLGMTATEWRPKRAVYPAVDLWSTPADLARFGRMVLRDGELDDTRVLSRASVGDMLRPSPPGEALGWQVRTLGRFHVVGHEGEDKEASTGLYLDRTEGTGAVVLASGDAFASGDKARAQAIGDLTIALLAVGVPSPHAD